MSLPVAVPTNFVLVRAVLVPVELSASIARARRFFFNGFYLYLRGTSNSVLAMVNDVFL